MNKIKDILESNSVDITLSLDDKKNIVVSTEPRNQEVNKKVKELIEADMYGYASGADYDA